MRGLSATLAAACRAAHGEPYVRLKIADAYAGAPRLRFTTVLHSAPGAPDVAHGAGCFAGGGLVRAYRESGSAVALQVIAAPSAGSAWTTWTSLGGLGSGSRCAVDCRGTFGVVAVDDGAAVKVRTSADSGGAWAGWTTAATAGMLGAVGCGQRSNGDRAVFFADGATLKAARQTAGVWGGASASPATFGSLSGLAALHDGSDWVVVATGTDSAGRAVVWTLRWGDGGALTAGSWEAPRVLVAADLNVTYSAPFVAMPYGVRLSFVEQYAGSGAYTLVLGSLQTPETDWDENLWHEPAPLPPRFARGAAMAVGPSAAYLCHPQEVRQSARPSLDGVDYSARLVEGWWDEPGRMHLVLDNADGALSGAILPGSEVEVAAGYITEAGAELPLTGALPVYWVDSVRLVDRRDGRSVVEVAGGDVLEALDWWRLRRQVVWPGTASVFAIVRQLAAWAGFGYAATTFSSEIATIAPAFTAQAGTSAWDAIRRVLALTRDRAIASGRSLASGFPQESDAAVWTYRLGAEDPAADEQPVWEAALDQRPVRPAFARVVGGGHVGQARDDDTLSQFTDAGIVVVDQGATSADEAASRALSLLRDSVQASRQDVLVCRPNVGQEPLDVVTLYSSRLGLSGVNRRVVQLRTSLNRRQGRYAQRLMLGAV